MHCPSAHKYAGRSCCDTSFQVHWALLQEKVFCHSRLEWKRKKPWVNSLIISNPPKMGNADQTDWNGTLAISFTNRNKKFSNIFFFQVIITKVNYSATMESSSGNRSTNTGMSEAFRRQSIFLYSWETKIDNMNSTLWFRGGMGSNAAREKAKQCAHPIQNAITGSCVHAILLQGTRKRYSDILWENLSLPYLEFSKSINAL